MFYIEVKNFKKNGILKYKVYYCMLFYKIFIQHIKCNLLSFSNRVIIIYTLLTNTFRKLQWTSIDGRCIMKRIQFNSIYIIFIHLIYFIRTEILVIIIFWYNLLLLFSICGIKLIIIMKIYFWLFLLLLILNLSLSIIIWNLFFFFLISFNYYK